MCVCAREKECVSRVSPSFRLTVCYNSIGDEGLCSLADTLRTANSTLTHADIWGNKIGEPTCNVSRDQYSFR